MRGVPVQIGGVFSASHSPRLLPVVLTVLVLGVAAVPASTTQTTVPPPSQARTLGAADLEALRQKAGQGDAAALCQLGAIYDEGQSVPKDETEAAKWFMLGNMLSGALENPCSAEMNRLLKQMPAERHAELLKRVTEWKKTVHFSEPRVLKEVKPDYDEEAMRAKITGDVWLAVILDTEGQPVELRVARSLDDRLDREAVKAARKWRFTPARIGDRAVPMLVNFQLSFELKR